MTEKAMNTRKSGRTVVLRRHQFAVRLEPGRRGQTRRLHERL